MKPFCGRLWRPALVATLLLGIGGLLPLRAQQTVKDYVYLNGRVLAIENAPILSITTATSLPAATAGASYATALMASGGTQPYTWSIVSGLPSWLSLSGSTLSGTPAAAAPSTTFVVGVADSGGLTATASLSITVNPAALAITTASLPAGVVGVAYSSALTASGGTAPYTWSVTGGALPAGLSLGGSTISGTPAGGSGNFTVQVTDQHGLTASSPLSIVVTTGLTISTSSLPAGITGLAYNAPLAASGGTGPYTWTIPSGYSLPPGLNLTNGAIVGTPTTPNGNPYTFNVKVTDSSLPNQTATASLSISIAPVTISLSSTSLAANAAAGGGTLTVTANVGWTGSSDSSWLTLSPVTGSPLSTAVSFSYTANASGGTRVGHLNFTTGSANTRFTVTQDKTHIYTITPPNINLYYNEIEQFQVSIDGGAAAVNSTTVTWSISNVSDGGAGGTITSAGYYTAPSTIRAQPATVTIQAAPIDGSSAATATVHVSAYLLPPGVVLVIGSGVSSDGTSGGPGGAFQFQLSPGGGADGIPAWVQLLFSPNGTGAPASQCYLNYSHGNSIGISTGTNTWQYSPSVSGSTTPAYNPQWVILNSQCAVFGGLTYANFSSSGPINTQTVNVDLRFASADAGQYQIWVMEGWDQPGETDQWIQAGAYTPSYAAAPSVALDSQGSLSGVAPITGWAIDNTFAANLGPIYAMNAYVDGVLIASTSPQVSSNLISRAPRTGGQYNPCTQYPGRSDCSAPGFTFNWNTSPYAGTSQHTVLITAEGGGQIWSYTSMTVTVSN